MLIQFLASAEKLSEAETVLDEARKKITGKEAPLAFAQCYEVLKKNEQAKEQYQLALAADPNSARITRIVADYAESHRRRQAGRGPFESDHRGQGSQGREGRRLWARRSLALIYLTRSGYENVEKARKLIEQNLADDPNSAVDKSLMASLNSRDPKAANRIEAIQSLQAIDEKPASLGGRPVQIWRRFFWPTRIGRAPAKCSANWRSTREDPQYLAIYIQELLNHGEVSDAEVYLRQLEEKWPNYVQTILLEAELLVRRTRRKKPWT